MGVLAAVGRAAVVLACDDGADRNLGLVACVCPLVQVRQFGRVAHLPGSTQVWDRASGLLQSCTPALCPYAVATPAQPCDVAAAAATAIAAAAARRRQRRSALLAAGTAAAAPANVSSLVLTTAAASTASTASTTSTASTAAALAADQAPLAVGDTVFANVAPLMGLSPLAVGVDALTTHSMQAHTLGWLARITDPEVVWAFMLDPDVPLGPMAYEHVAPSSMRRWAGAGYPAAAIQDYLTLTSQALTHPNQLGFPAALQRFGAYRATLHAAAYNMSLYGNGAYGNGSSSNSASAAATGRTEADIMAAMADAFAAQFGPNIPGYSTLRLQYLVSIGRWDLLNAPAPAAPPPPEQARNLVGRITVPRSVKYKPAGPAVAAAVTSVGVAALVTLAALGYKQLLVKRGWGRRADPGVGPDTSLVVTVSGRVC